MRGAFLINWRAVIIFRLVHKLKKKSNPTEEEGIGIVVLILYGMFICRVTSWGRDFYLWINTQPEWLEIKSGNKG